ncbi:hypothetical protein SDJN02_23747 [Cucurbita argyrosperma subsp. argyrosperma]|nr:hypothetical protein SDJN02_23747 [Cucurbita argyrosperma subsp. argyrosperma]
MEIGVENDDLLFAELTRRISLLIMDDNELSIVHTDLTRSVHRVQTEQLPLMVDHKHGFVRESKGTGVYIPTRLPLSRKKQKNATSYGIKSENKRLDHQRSFKPLIIFVIVFYYFKFLVIY